MTFWQSDLGEITGKAEDAFAKESTFVRIPNGTMALARIDSFMHAENQGLPFLQIEWQLVDGDFKGQKVNQKLKVFEGDPRDKDPAKTKHRALNMLKLIYQQFDIKPKHANTPTNDDLAIFIGKIGGIKVRETEPNADGKQYNWVAEIHPATGFKSETGVKLEVTHVNGQKDLFNAFDRNKPKVANGLEGLEDDIPF